MYTQVSEQESLKHRLIVRHQLDGVSTTESCFFFGLDLLTEKPYYCISRFAICNIKKVKDEKV